MKKRKSASGPGSLDSLLDTMTNVVGILVIVLVVTQLGVGDAVKRIHKDISEISRQEYEEKLAKVDELKVKLETDKQNLKEIEASSEDDQKMKRFQTKQVELAKTDIARIQTSLADSTKRTKELDDTKKKVEELEKKISDGREEIAKIKAMLEDAPPVKKGPEATVVTLPDPRAAPKGATAVEFICQHGRVVRLDVDRLRKIAVERMQKSERQLTKQGAIDCQALKRMFDKEKIGNAYFRVAIHVGKDKPSLIISHNPQSGDTTKKLNELGSVYRRVLRNIDRRKAFIRFRVFPDSFDTYLAAREVASSMGIQAGWAPYHENFVHRVGLGLPGNVYCSGYTPPPPPPKPKKKPKPKPKPKPANPAPPPPPVPKDDID